MIFVHLDSLKYFRGSGVEPPFVPVLNRFCTCNSRYNRLEQNTPNGWFWRGSRYVSLLQDIILIRRGMYDLILPIVFSKIIEDVWAILIDQQVSSGEYGSLISFLLSISIL